MAKPLTKTFVPHFSDRYKHTIFICYKLVYAIWQVVFSGKQSEEKVCEQNVYQGLTHVKWEYSPEKAAEL